MFMSEMFAEPDLQTMQLVRCAFDPDHLSNPGKIFRVLLCARRDQGPYVPHPLEISGEAQFFYGHAWIRKSYFGTSPGRTTHNCRRR